MEPAAAGSALKSLRAISLRSRLVLLALAAILPALLVVLYDHSFERAWMRDRVVAESRRLLRTAGRRQAIVFEGTDRVLSTLNESPGLSASTPAQCRSVLRNAVANWASINNIWLIEADGTISCAAAPLSGAAALDDRTRQWFLQAMERRQTVVGNFDVRLLGGSAAVALAHPVLDGSGKARRILAASVLVDRLNRVALDAAIPSGAVLLLFDRNRTILARDPDGSQWVGRHLPDSVPVGDQDQGRTADAVTTAAVDGVERLYVTTRLASTLASEMYLALGIDTRSVFADASRQRDRQFLLLVLVALATGLLAALGAETFVVRPVGALEGVSQRLARGDFAARAQVSTSVPGLGSLGEAINELAQALDEREQALKVSEARYRYLFHENPCPMWVIDRDSLKFVEVNAAAVAHYGYSRDEFLSLRVTDIRPAEEIPRLLATLANTEQSWGRKQGWHHRLKSGAMIEVDVASHAVTFDGRQCMLALVQDVTDRAAAERALAERRAMTELMAEIGATLNRPRPQRWCLQACADALQSHLDLTAVRIWTLQGPDEAPMLAAGAGSIPDASQAEVANVVKRVASTGFPVDGLEEPSTADDGREESRVAADTRSTLLAHPLIVQHHVVGVVAVWVRETLSDGAILAIASAADHLALGVERHQAEDARARLASIVEDSDDAVLTMTLDGKIRSWNASATLLYGHTADEAVGRPLSIIIPPEREEEAGQVFAKIAAGDRIRHLETFHRRKDGSVLPVSLTQSPMRDETGAIIGVSSNARDISARQRAEDALRETEERMRFALEAARMGVWETTRQGTTHWSETCELMHGLRPGTFDGTVDAFLKCVHPEDRERVRASNLARARLQDTNLEYRTVWPDGSEHCIVSSGRYTYDDAGAPVRGAGIVIDVTDRRSLEDQLRQAQKMEAIGQLAGGVAHDFNNLLTAIQGYAEFLSEDLAENDPRRDDAQQIVRSSQRAAKLTRQLLAFGRRQVLMPRVLQAGSIVAEVLPMLRRLIGENIDLKAIATDHGHVKVDAGQLGQVLMNLVVNARDAMRDGGILTVETADLMLDDHSVRQYPSLAPGPHVVLAVTDTGCGMDEGTQARIFEPFFTTKPQGEGTGLGLSMAYGIVKQSGGAIRVESRPGRGSTFTICLPRVDEPIQADTHAPRATKPPGRGVILVVEDEDNVRELVAKTLSRQGYTVHMASRPSAAIEFSRNYHSSLDLLISDVVLPEMTGRDLAALIAEQHPESRVLLMSGYAGTLVSDARFGTELPFLQKPFDPDSLTIRVQDLLEGSAPQGADAIVTAG